MTRRELARVCVGLGVLSLVMTWPQVTQLSTHVGMHYDALFSTWRIAWIAHQLPRNPAHLFDGNIFFPEPNTLAFSDITLLPALVVAPLLWIGVPPLVAYNVLVLAAFASAGIAAYLLARSLGVSQLAASFAGVVFAFQPYRFAHYPHLELLWTCWIPLAFWALHRVVDNQRIKESARLGMFVGFQALSCVYYALFLVIGLCVVAPIDALASLRGRVGRLWKLAAAAVVVASVLVAPYVVPYSRSSTVVGLRTLDDVQRWSPTLRSYTFAQHGNVVYPPPPNEVDAFEHVLFPGITPLVAAIGGLAFVRHRRVLAYAVLLVIAFDLSLGTNGFFYPVVYELIPPMRGLRVPARMFVLVSLALSLLGAFGIDRLSRARSGHYLAVAAVMTALVETASLPLKLQQVPPRSHVHQWLAQQPPGAVLEWPFPVAANLGFTRDPLYMYLSTAHWQPLVNGYSGNYPLSYLSLLDSAYTFPDKTAIDAIVERGVRYLLLHSQPDERRYIDVVQQLTTEPRVSFQFADNTGTEEISVYLVNR
jgi:hypothetical protein